MKRDYTQKNSASKGFFLDYILGTYLRQPKVNLLKTGWIKIKREIFQSLQLKRQKVRLLFCGYLRYNHLKLIVSLWACLRPKHLYQTSLGEGEVLQIEISIQSFLNFSLNCLPTMVTNSNPLHHIFLVFSFFSFLDIEQQVYRDRMRKDGKISQNQSLAKNRAHRFHSNEILHSKRLNRGLLIKMYYAQKDRGHTL